MSDEIHYRILTFLESRPEISQRRLSKELGISLGKANYCVRAMLDKGWIKVTKFRDSRNKVAYAYLLTPEGFERKARMAVRFLKRKMTEYEDIKREIAQLRQEVGQPQTREPTTGSEKKGQ